MPADEDEAEPPVFPFGVSSSPLDLWPPGDSGTQFSPLSAVPSGQVPGDTAVFSPPHAASASRHQAPATARFEAPVLARFPFFKALLMARIIPPFRGR